MRDKVQDRKVPGRANLWARHRECAAKTGKMGPTTAKVRAWVRARVAIKEAAATAGEAGRAAEAAAEEINQRNTINPKKYGGVLCQD
jgi:hypothetical protein